MDIYNQKYTPLLSKIFPFAKSQLSFIEEISLPLKNEVTSIYICTTRAYTDTCASFNEETV